jgi:hypothetical protein
MARLDGTGALEEHPIAMSPSSWRAASQTRGRRMAGEIDGFRAQRHGTAHDQPTSNP